MIELEPSGTGIVPLRDIKYAHGSDIMLDKIVEELVKKKAILFRWRKQGQKSFDQPKVLEEE